MEIVLSNINPLSLLAITAVCTAMMMRDNFKRSSNDCFNTIKALQVMVVSLVGFPILYILLMSPVFAFFPKFFGQNFHLGLQLIFCIVLADVIAFFFTWILKGQNSPLVKIWKKV